MFQWVVYQLAHNTIEYNFDIVIETLFVEVSVEYNLDGMERLYAG